MGVLRPFRRVIGDSLYVPSRILDVPGNVNYTFTNKPIGIIFHSTRSGQVWSVHDEFEATLRYVRLGAAGLGWNCTVGDNEIAIHGPANMWGWNARAASSKMLAIEFAQARLGGFISDDQIKTAAWYIKTYALHIPRYYPEHLELPEGIADGKSDIDSGQNVPARVLALLP